MQLTHNMGVFFSAYCLRSTTTIHPVAAATAASNMTATALLPVHFELITTAIAPTYPRQSESLSAMACTLFYAALDAPALTVAVSQQLCALVAYQSARSYQRCA